jgi:hypothetical protein
MPTTVLNFSVILEDLPQSHRRTLRGRVNRGRYALDAGLAEMENILSYVRANNIPAQIRVGGEWNRRNPEATTPTQQTATAEQQTGNSGQLGRIESMLQRLLLPQELRHLPNADDAHAVLALDVPAASLNEAE